MKCCLKKFLVIIFFDYRKTFYSDVLVKITTIICYALEKYYPCGSTEKVLDILNYYSKNVPVLISLDCYYLHLGSLETMKSHFSPFCRLRDQTQEDSMVRF